MARHFSRRTLSLPPGARDRRIERWADTKLPITAGLEFWLDASRENAAREVLQLEKIPNGARSISGMTPLETALTSRNAPPPAAPISS